VSWLIKALTLMPNVAVNWDMNQPGQRTLLIWGSKYQRPRSNWLVSISLFSPGDTVLINFKMARFPNWQWPQTTTFLLRKGEQITPSVSGLDFHALLSFSPWLPLDSHQIVILNADSQGPLQIRQRIREAPTKLTGLPKPFFCVRCKACKFTRPCRFTDRLVFLFGQVVHDCA
jgi:hypothetical protein